MILLASALDTTDTAWAALVTALQTQKLKVNAVKASRIQDCLFKLVVG